MSTLLESVARAAFALGGSLQPLLLAVENMSATIGEGIAPAGEAAGEAAPVVSDALQLTSSDGINNVWSFVEPITVGRGTCTTKPQAQAVVHLSAPAKLSPLKAYMYFAYIKDTSGSKAAQYEKYYTNTDRFMKVVNERFGTRHSVGVMRGMMQKAKEERLKLRWEDAVSVKILQVVPCPGR